MAYRVPLLTFFRETLQFPFRLPTLGRLSRTASWGILLLSSSALLHCSSEENYSAPSDEYPNGDGNSSGGPPSPDPDASLQDLTLRFEHPRTLLLKPGERFGLSVQLEPAAVKRIDLGLVAEEPQTIQDAFLDKTQVETDSSGAATVQLRAPSSAGTFRIRASIDNQLETYQAVSVSSRGFGSLLVVPQYEGQRQVAEWTVSARAGTTCDKLTDYSIDGPLQVVGGSPLLLEGLPAGPPIALTVRSGQRVASCVTLPEIQANERRTLIVRVIDLPLRLETSTIQVDLGLSTNTEPLHTHLGTLVEENLERFTQQTTDDIELLLNLLESKLPSSALQEFRSRRASGALRTMLLQAWGDGSKLRHYTRTLLQNAESTLRGPQVLQGTLSFPAHQALFTLERVGGAPLASPTTHSWTRRWEAGNQLAMSGHLGYQLNHWLLNVAEYNTPPSPGDALSERALCQQLPGLWADLPEPGLPEPTPLFALFSDVPPEALNEPLPPPPGELPPGDSEEEPPQPGEPQPGEPAPETQILPGCTESCLIRACRQGLDGAWQRMRQPEELPTPLSLAITATVEENELGNVAQLRGTWLGTNESLQFPLGGPFFGKQK